MTFEQTDFENPSNPKTEETELKDNSEQQEDMVFSDEEAEKLSKSYERDINKKLKQIDRVMVELERLLPSSSTELSQSKNLLTQAISIVQNDGDILKATELVSEALLVANLAPEKVSSVSRAKEKLMAAREKDMFKIAGVEILTSEDEPTIPERRFSIRSKEAMPGFPVGVQIDISEINNILFSKGLSPESINRACFETYENHLDEKLEKSKFPQEEEATIDKIIAGFYDQEAPNPPDFYEYLKENLMLRAKELEMKTWKEQFLFADRGVKLVQRRESLAFIDQNAYWENDGYKKIMADIKFAAASKFADKPDEMNDYIAHEIKKVDNYYFANWNGIEYEEKIDQFDQIKFIGIEEEGIKNIRDKYVNKIDKEYQPPFVQPEFKEAVKQIESLTNTYYPGTPDLKQKFVTRSRNYLIKNYYNKDNYVKGLTEIFENSKNLRSSEKTEQDIQKYIDSETSDLEKQIIIY